MTRVEQQLDAAGYLAHIDSLAVHGETVRGSVSPLVQHWLLIDERFQRGGGYLLHKDVGNRLVDLRSCRGTFGYGSLQVVFDQQTGAFYADVDKFSPYADVVGAVGHLFGEVIPHWFRGKPKDAHG